MFGGGIGSFNDDVIGASPDSPEDALKLIEEIKSRAKAAIGTRNYPEAIKLYTKAAEVCPIIDLTSKAIILANRSMCFLNMGNNDHAFLDAEEATKTDPAYVKGYYRKSSALIAIENFVAAEKVVLEGLSLKPGDKDFNTQLLSVRKSLAQQQSSGKNKVDQKGKEDADNRGTNIVSSNASHLLSKVDKSDETVAVQPSEDEDEAEAGSSTETFRGYKKTKDGKVTTFFNREIDEQTKALIGSIAPKKIDSSSADVAASVAGSSATVVGSVWNSAGTFESTDYTTWSISRLKDLITAAAPRPYSFKNVVVSGDAQTTVMRGKKKCICDFTVELDWDIDTAADAAGAEGGRITITDVTADREYEFDLGPSRPVVQQHSNPLKTLLTYTLNSFMDELSAK